jgi:Na+/proline symporter
MYWIDWVIALCPLLIVAALVVWSRQHVKSVADFLTGRRVAGRYLLTVSNMEASQGVIGLLAVYEAYYQSGFAYGFWEALNVAALIVMALTGYCVYRFRETRAMTMGQFLEIRYSRRFRIFAGVLQALSGVLNYGLFPAVSGRFFVYFCGLPTEVTVLGFVLPTFALIMAAYLSVAALLAISGGQLSIMVADCLVGVLSYPMYLLVVAYIVWRFSWVRDLAPTLLNRQAGHSLINPFDIAQLRDFNLFYVGVGIFGGILNRMSWSGNQGFYAAGRNAHEQKMSGVLQTWRIGFSKMMYVLVPVVALAYFNSSKYAGGPNGADACRTELATKVAQEVMARESLAGPRQEVISFLNTGTITPNLRSLLDNTAPLATGNPSSASTGTSSVVASERVQVAQEAIRGTDPSASQTFGTIFRQMSVPMAVRRILPIGIVGAFCAIAISLLMATDSSYQHSWAAILVQDIIVPLRGKPLPPRKHLFLLRLMIVSVASFSFVFSYLFGQVDYILMFFAITGAIWLGGSGPCIVGGLYWKRGTTAGAWCALISGSSLAVSSLIIQKYWVGAIYPWLVQHQLVDTVTRWLETSSRPFEPIIKWRMSADHFPINSQELFAINILISLGLYIVVSLLTCREPFNMDRMLHRGKYRRADEPIAVRERLTIRNMVSKLIGIDSEYTRADKVLAWSVFLWSFVWGFGFCFVVVAMWNWIRPWSDHAWSLWFYINNFILAGVVGAVSSVWFTIGGVTDLRQLFRDLKVKRQNVLEDGWVVDHVSSDDVALVEKIDHVILKDETPGVETTAVGPHPESEKP